MSAVSLSHRRGYAVVASPDYVARWQAKGTPRTLLGSPIASHPLRAERVLDWEFEKDAGQW